MRLQEGYEFERTTRGFGPAKSTTSDAGGGFVDPVSTTKPAREIGPSRPVQPPPNYYQDPPLPPDVTPAPTDGPVQSGSNDAVARATVQDLYPEMPETGTMDVPTVGDPVGADITQSDLGEGTVATPTDAATNTDQIVAGAVDEVNAATGAAEQTNLTPEQQVDAELARILGKDSPLLASARQEAMRQMNARGLTNTSMAAGATYGAMVDKALPMAQQNAQQALQRELDNTRNRQEMSTLNVEQIAQLRSLEAELGQELAITNADQLAQAQRLTAELRSSLEQGNTEAFNRAAEQLADLNRDAQKQQADLEGVAAEREFLEQQAYNELQLENIAELNRQYMVGEQNIDVQDVIGSYAQIRSVNETASSMTNSYISAIAQIYDNPDMSASQAAEAIRNMTTMYQGTMDMISAMNNMDLGDGGGGGGDTAPPPGNFPRDYPDNKYPPFNEPRGMRRAFY